MRWKFFCVLLVVFFVSFISAGFETGNLSHSIDKEYNQEDFVRGWINISLANVDLNSTFESNQGDTITLFDLLKLSNLFTDCDTPNCDVDYDTSNAEAVKVLNLVKDEEKLVGFKFSENLLGIDSIDFNISSNAPKSCYNQLKLDLLDDGFLDFANTNVAGEFCSFSRTKGCFNDGAAFQEGLLTSIQVCQRVTLPETRGFMLGVDISSIVGEGTKTVNMGIYDLNGLSVGACSISSINSSGEFFCETPGFSDKTADYYVCASGNGDTKVNFYEDSQNGCGFAGMIPGDETFSYNLIASSMQFDVFENFSISDYYSGFVSDARYYLESKYGNLDCKDKNCVVPIKIISGVTQQVILSNLYGIYQISGIAREISPEFYDLSEIPLKYNSGFQQIYLDKANFSVGDKEVFLLKLNGEEIFSEDIVVRNTPLINFLNPQIVVAAVPTEFSVSIDTSKTNSSVVSYVWNFGNGDVRNTAENSVSYTYNSTGSFNVTVSITDSNQLVNSKSFNVLVDTPIRAVNATLVEKFNSLNNVKSELNSFSAFAKSSLESIFNLGDAESKLTKIKIDFDSAVLGVSDDYYIGLMKDLLGISLPNSVVVSKSAQMIPFYFEKDKINMDALTLLEGEYPAERKQDYEEAVLSWSLENLVNLITYKEISADYDDELNVVLNVFELDVKGDLEKTPYLIFKKMEGLSFDKDYNKREIGDYIFIPLSDNLKIVFSLTEEISFSDLPLFISPTIDNLNVSEEVVEDNGVSRWVLFWLIIFFLVLVAVVVYIILQRWYSKKYENYLFKNKNDLYNLISFIENSKKKGTSEEKIVESLKKSGWKGEQLRYIIRKYLGKRTGMFEIPIEKVLNVFKKKQVVSEVNTQGRPVRRTAQRPGFNAGFRRNMRR